MHSTPSTSLAPTPEEKEPDRIIIDVIPENPQPLTSKQAIMPKSKGKDLSLLMKPRIKYNTLQDSLYFSEVMVKDQDNAVEEPEVR